MTSNLDSRAPSAGDRRRARAYLVEFVPGIVLTMVLLFAALTWGGFGGSSPARFVWAVLPVLPLAWIAVAVLRHARRLDPYQRERLLAGLGVGFAAAMIAAVAVGMLESAGMRVDGTAFWIYGAGMLAWAVTAVAGRR